MWLLSTIETKMCPLRRLRCVQGEKIRFGSSVLSQKDFEIWTSQMINLDVPKASNANRALSLSYLFLGKLTRLQRSRILTSSMPWTRTKHAQCLNVEK